MIGSEFRMYYDLGYGGYCIFILLYYTIIVLYYTLKWLQAHWHYIINWRDATQFDSEDDYSTGCRDVSHWDASVQFIFSKEKCESLPAPLCNRRFIQYARIPACWINCPFYKIRAKVIFHRCCYLRYRLLMSPYSWGLHDLRVQCVAVLSIYSLTLVLSLLW